VPGCLVALLIMAGTAPAYERWGKVKSIDVRFNKVTMIQDGNNRSYETGLYPETIFVLLDGTTMENLDIHQLEGKRIFALVEENPEHYVTKLWIRKDVPPELDPVDPGVGASRR
jgi:hypothetical protein